MSSTRNGRGASCRPCRERHVKCDRGTPSCSNCTRSRYLLNCVYESPQFKFRTRILASRASADDTNRRSRARASSSAGSPSEASPAPVESSPPQQTGHGAPRGAVTHESVWSSPAEQQSNLQLQPALPDPGSSGPANDFIDNPTKDITAPGNLPAGIPYSTSLIDAAAQSVSVRAEADIFSFYLHTVGPWLDIVSPSRLFGLHVPRMAASEPVLRSACLAYGSHVMYLHHHIPLEVKETLHDRAVRELIPLLTSCHRGRAPEAVLATTVLLRMTEQFLEPDEDRQHHLYGSSTLFETGYTNWSLSADSLSTTSFWAYLRGSIRVSFLREQPCPFQLDPLTTVWEDACLTASVTDEAYTNAITYLLAELCTVCWGEAASPDSSISMMTRLEHAIADWKSRLPESFQPWYLEFNEHDTFPDVRYVAPWHYVAWQFYYAAQVMLAVYSPTMSHDTNILQLTRMLEDKIATPTRWLCGVTLCSKDYGVKINGSHLVAWSAQFITGRAEQNKILQLLVSLWEETGWPNQTCCVRLRGLWSGSRRSWARED